MSMLYVKLEGMIFINDILLSDSNWEKIDLFSFWKHSVTILVESMIQWY